MTIAAVPSQPTFVHLVIAAPIRHEHRRKAGHRRAVAAASPERSACIHSRILVLLRAFPNRERLYYKPHARPALHAAASVLPRVIAHLPSSFQSSRLTRRSSGTPAGDEAAVSRHLPLRYGHPASVDPPPATTAARRSTCSPKRPGNPSRH